MIKSIQTKIILIFFVIGILVIGALSFFHIGMLERMSQPILDDSYMTQQEELKNVIETQIAQTKVVTVIVIGIFAIITLLVGYFVSRSITKPINTLIENAEKIAKGEEVEIENKIREISIVESHLQERKRIIESFPNDSVEKKQTIDSTISKDHKIEEPKKDTNQERIMPFINDEEYGIALEKTKGPSLVLRRKPNNTQNSQK